jgi:hypothetical protein
MPCVSPDGRPTSTGMALLKSLKNGALSPEEITSKTGQPLFRVRSGLRELKNAGFIEEAEDKYRLSETGKTIADWYPIKHWRTSSFFGFTWILRRWKKLREENSANIGRKIVETIEFEETEAEKLEVIKRSMGLKQNTEVIKALICEKCDEIKLMEEKRRERQIEEAKAMEWLEKGKYTSPM